MRKLKRGTILMDLGPSEKGCTVEGEDTLGGPDENSGLGRSTKQTFNSSPGQLVNGWIIQSFQQLHCSLTISPEEVPKLGKQRKLQVPFVSFYAWIGKGIETSSRK